MLRMIPIFAIALVAAACAEAPEPGPAGADEGSVKRCRDFAEIGALMMSARQNGKPKAGAMEIVNRGEVPEVNRALRALLDAAYAVPLRDSKEERSDEIVRFATDTMETCLSASKKAAAG